MLLKIKDLMNMVVGRFDENTILVVIKLPGIEYDKDKYDHLNLLQYACRQGWIELARFLIKDALINPNEIIRDGLYEGCTAMDICACDHNLKMMKVLMCSSQKLDVSIYPPRNLSVSVNKEMEKEKIKLIQMYEKNWIDTRKQCIIDTK